MPMSPRQYRPAGQPAKTPEKQWRSRQSSTRAMYASPQWRALRLARLELDCWLCCECKRQGVLTALGKYGQVHHLDVVQRPEDVLCSIERLESLCASCHSRATGEGARRG